MLTFKERLIYGGLSFVMGRNLISAAEDVRDRAHWPQSKMEDFRLERCQELLRQADANVPYYHELFRSCGFDPGRFETFGDLENIPPLTREQLMSSYSALRNINTKPSDLKSMSTGGTSGKPVKVLLQKTNSVERMLVNHRMYATMGRTLGVSTMLIAGSPIDAQRWLSYRARIKDALFNVTVRSSFGLTPSALEDLVAELGSGKYRFVIAYASVFDVLASYVVRKGVNLQLQNIVPCAELVTAAQRARWRDAFGAQIFEIYGSREMSSIAGETPEHDGLSINSDVYHVEVTNRDGRCLPHGEPGLITITNLIEHGFPLIRYQLGDMGVIAEAPKGNPFPCDWLNITHGRMLDVIYCPDGNFLPGEFFPHLFKEVSGKVDRYQIVQVEINRLIAKVVRGEGYSNDTTEYLTRKMIEQLGSEMQIAFDFVENIEVSVSGKYRPTMNLIPDEYKSLK